MSNKEGFSPVVITVGDELVFGEQQNTNQQWLASALWQKGIPAKLSLVLPDNIDTIAQWIRYLLYQKHNLIIVSGGIGGTHDDCTRPGIAMGLGVELVQHKECLTFLQARALARKFKITPLVERMTFLPEGCELIENETGMPGFHLNGVYAFPGFPNMLQPMAMHVLDNLMPDTTEEDNWITKEVIFPVAESVVGPYIETFLLTSPYAKIGIYPDNQQCHHQVKIKFRTPVYDEKAAGKFNELVKKLNSLSQ